MSAISTTAYTPLLHGITTTAMPEMPQNPLDTETREYRLFPVEVELRHVTCGGAFQSLSCWSDNNGTHYGLRCLKCGVTGRSDRPASDIEYRRKAHD